jgi:hypothetical protein
VSAAVDEAGQGKAVTDTGGDGERLLQACPGLGRVACQALEVRHYLEQRDQVRQVIDLTRSREP